MGADVTGLQQLVSHKPTPDPQAGERASEQAGPEGLQTPGTELVGRAFADLDHQAPVEALKDAVTSSGGSGNARLMARAKQPHRGVQRLWVRVKDGPWGMGDRSL